MNQLYQDANSSPSYDIKFGGGVIKVSTDDGRIPEGWEVNINKQVSIKTSVIKGQTYVK